MQLTIDGKKYDFKFGVGFVRKPYVYLKKDDVVRIAIEGLGYIENKVEFE